MDIIITVISILITLLIVVLFAIWRFSKEIAEIEDGEQLDN